MSKYTLSVFNTITGRYEVVPVTEEVYRTYRRTGWSIDNNNASYYDHEIQFSQLIGGDDGNYENFHEFVSDADAVSNEAIDAIYKDLLYKAMDSLTADEAELITALFFDGKTERQYADELGVYRNAVHKKKMRILEKIKKLIEI